MLASLHVLGYRVEWRVINAAKYGFPQRRRRVFIVGQLSDGTPDINIDKFTARETIFKEGVLAKALPIKPLTGTCPFDLESGFQLCEGPAGKADLKTVAEISTYLSQISEVFGSDSKKSRFCNAGVMIDGLVFTVDVEPVDIKENEKRVLRDVVEEAKKYRSKQGLNDEPFYLDPSNPKEEEKWRELKGAKKIPRTNRASGFKYNYTEGKMDFPDSMKKPSRTILTGEGGSTPSRFKHVIEDSDGKRRLTPEELEILNGFLPGHTKLPDDHPVITDGKRAFLMGNALVVGVVEKIGAELKNRMKVPKNKKATAEKPSPPKKRKELVATTAD